MNEWFITPSPLSGSIPIPPSKSHTLRAILFALMADGKSVIDNILDSPDTDAMIDAISALGAKVDRDGNKLTILGNFEGTSEIIDAGNSGQVLRFIGAIAALLPTYTTITGDASIRTKRPVKPLLSGLRQLGALAECALGDGHAPILIRGPMKPGVCRIDGQDSQPVSGLLIATAFLNGPSDIFVDHPGETPWINLTLNWLKRLGAPIANHEYCHYKVAGNLRYKGFTYTVPGDFSSAAFAICAALITQSSLEITGLDPLDVQGDKKIIEVLQKMGANISWSGDRLSVHPSQLRGIEIDINPFIDALPILAVIGCFAEGTTTLYNGAIARQKESDRIYAICHELLKMGANIEECEDGVKVAKSSLEGAILHSHHDHRIALALSVAAMGASSPSTIQAIECVGKSYPHFVEEFQHIGASIELDPIRV